MQLEEGIQFFRSLIGDISAIVYPVSEDEKRQRTGDQNTPGIFWSPTQRDRIISVSSRLIGMLILTNDLVFIIHCIAAILTFFNIIFFLLFFVIGYDFIRFGYNISQNLPEQTFFTNVNYRTAERSVRLDQNGQFVRNEKAIDLFMQGTIVWGLVWQNFIKNKNPERTH